MRSVVWVFFCVSLLLFQIEAQLPADTFDCCCITNEQWGFVRPFDVTFECLYNIYGTSYYSADYGGYASELDGCVGACATSCSSECGTFANSHLDVYGIDRQSTSQSFLCGSSSHAVTLSALFQASCGGTIFSLTQTITYEDTIAPELVIPPDMTVECFPDITLGSYSSLFGDARATDLCTDPYMTTSNSVDSSDSCDVVVTRTFTATDYCQESSDTQTVHIVDTTPPIIEGVVDQVRTVECDNVPTASTPNTYDGCQSGLSINHNDVIYPGKCTYDYTIERTWSADDGCNNVATYTEYIHVQDTTSPYVTPTPATDRITYLSCTYPPLVSYTLNDNCATPTYSYVDSIIGDPEIDFSYEVIRDYTLVDDCGNTATWTEVYNVALPNSLSVVPVTASVSATKGAPFDASFTVAYTTCISAYLMVDIGAASLNSYTVSSGSLSCVDRGMGIVCDIPTTNGATTSFDITFTLSVSSSYAANFLEISASFSDTVLPFSQITGANGASVIVSFS